MNITYRPGRPNILTLTKALQDASPDPCQGVGSSEGAP
jgi:hypothetical protein